MIMFEIEAQERQQLPLPRKDQETRRDISVLRENLFGSQHQNKTSAD